MHVKNKDNILHNWGNIFLMATFLDNTAKNPVKVYGGAFWHK